MEATVLMTLANKSHTGKPQEKKRRKDLPESKSIQGLSVSLAGLTCRDIKVQRRRTGWEENQNKPL